mmetsp:Transcript_31955/g.93990  ORF Transcript_31955/g.93990 Transcript_31955/m.93990 type:complete len:207 (+) Transcript_31955:974-1594(+)
MGKADTDNPIPLPVTVHFIVELLEGYIGDVIPSIAPGRIDGADHGVKGVEVIKTLAGGQNHHVGLAERLGIVARTPLGQDVLLLAAMGLSRLPGILDAPEGAGHDGREVLHRLADVANLLSAIRILASWTSGSGGPIAPLEGGGDPLLRVGQHRPDPDLLAASGVGARWGGIVGLLVVEAGGSGTASDGRGGITKDTRSVSRSSQC